MITTIASRVESLLLKRIGSARESYYPFREDMRCMEVLGNGIGVVEFMHDLEEEFHLHLTGDVWPSSATLGQVLDTVQILVTEKFDMPRGTFSRPGDHPPTPHPEQEPAVAPTGLLMRYFVLSPFSGDPAHAEASKAAIRAYADTVRATQPDMADQLLEWANQGKIR